MSNSIPLSHSLPSYFNNFIDFGKQTLNKKQAFVKINDIQIERANKQRIGAYIGSRRVFKNRMFSCENAKTKTWNFCYSNKNQASFVLALYNQESMFGNGKLLGEIEIRLSSFKTNHITKHTFILRSTDRYSEPIRVTLTIHLNEDGSKAFSSPESNILNYEYEIINKRIRPSSFENLTI